MASALEDHTPGTARRRAGQVALLAQRVRRVPARERRLLALMVAVLALLPPGVALTRSTAFRTEVRFVSAAPARPFPGNPERYVRRLLHRSSVVAAIESRLGDRWRTYEALFDDATVDAGRSAVVVGLPGTTSADAELAAAVVARGVAGESERAAADRREAVALLATATRRLREPDLSVAERRELRRTLAYARAALPGTGDNVALVAADLNPKAEVNVVDRAVNALPGDAPPRESPLWTGVAGLLLGLALCSLWMLVRRGQDI